MARKRGSTDYPLTIKLEAVRLWEDEDLGYKEITERLAIRDPKRVKEWMRIYRKEGAAGLKKARRGRPRKDPNGLEVRIKQLEMENTLLKALAIELGEEPPTELSVTRVSSMIFSSHNIKHTLNGMDAEDGFGIIHWNFQSNQLISSG